MYGILIFLALSYYLVDLNEEEIYDFDEEETN